MARFDRDKFPELFPATLTEFAAPVHALVRSAGLHVRVDIF